MAERAEQIAIRLQEMVEALQSPSTAPDDRNRLAHTVELCWGALHGMDVLRVKRMRIVAAVAFAAESAREAQHDAASLGRPNLQADVVTIVREFIKADQPDAAAALTDSSIEQAVAAWLRAGKQRKDVREPLRWEAVEKLTVEAGLSGMNAGSLKTEWADWQRMQDR